MFRLGKKKKKIQSLENFRSPRNDPKCGKVPVPVFRLEKITSSENVENSSKSPVPVSHRAIRPSTYRQRRGMGGSLYKVIRILPSPGHSRSGERSRGHRRARYGSVRRGTTFILYVEARVSENRRARVEVNPAPRVLLDGRRESKTSIATTFGFERPPASAFTKAFAARPPAARAVCSSRAVRNRIKRKGFLPLRPTQSNLDYHVLMPPGVDAGGESELRTAQESDDRFLAPWSLSRDRAVGARSARLPRGACHARDSFRSPIRTFSLKRSYLVDPASSHMLVSKIKPCMSKYMPY